MPDGNVKLLGAAIVSQSWCEALLKRRVVKARNLLALLQRLGQGALLVQDGTPAPPDRRVGSS